MISRDRNVFLNSVADFKSLENVDKEILIRNEQNNELHLEIPDKFQTNKEKTVYKIGFLVEFLQFLYPEKTRNEIYDRLNSKYHIFITKRQMQRNYKEYLENKNYH